MKAVIRILIVLAIGGGLAFVAVRGYERYQARQAQKTLAAERGKKTEPLRITCAKVLTGDIARTPTLTGTVRAMAEVDVVSKISGRLERLRLPDGTLLDEGVVIKEAGTLIAEIDHKQIAAEVALAEAAVAVAEAASLEAEAVRKNAEREKNRIVDLFKQGGINEQAKDQAVNAHERATAGKALAEARVEQAKRALAAAKVTLDEAFIKAPIAGVVARKYLDEGNMVSPATPIVRIINVDTVKVIVGVNERDIEHLEPGRSKATITVDSAPGKVVEGVVAKIGVSSDDVTHTVGGEIQVANPERRLLPGAFARVTLGLGKKKDVVLVPDSAIVRRGGETYVFVVKDLEGNKARVHMRSVRLGLSDGARTEVTNGLEAGEVVATSGQNRLHEGDAVIIDTSSSNPGAEVK